MLVSSVERPRSRTWPMDGDMPTLRLCAYATEERAVREPSFSSTSAPKSDSVGVGCSGIADRCDEAEVDAVVDVVIDGTDDDWDTSDVESWTSNPRPLGMVGTAGMTGELDRLACLIAAASFSGRVRDLRRLAPGDPDLSPSVSLAFGL